jgi:hypothetical protein
MKKAVLRVAALAAIAASLALVQPDRTQAATCHVGWFNVSSYELVWIDHFGTQFTQTNRSLWHPTESLSDYIAMRKAPDGSYPYQRFVPGGGRHEFVGSQDVPRITGFGNQFSNTGQVYMEQTAMGSC